MTSTLRVPIVRIDADGTTTDGTAEWTAHDDDSFHVGDFRDLDGEPLSLPPQSRFEFGLLGDDES